MSRTFILLGSLNAFLAVALGAFGAHGLKQILTETGLQTWQTGVHYHIVHALGLLEIADIQPHIPAARHAGWLMLIGIVLFSGSLYALSLSGIRMLGIITPLGGVAFLLGWLWLAISAYKQD